MRAGAHQQVADQLVGPVERPPSAGRRASIRAGRRRPRDTRRGERRELMLQLPAHSGKPCSRSTGRPSSAPGRKRVERHGGCRDREASDILAAPVGEHRFAASLRKAPVALAALAPSMQPGIAAVMPRRRAALLLSPCKRTSPSSGVRRSPRTRCRRPPARDPPPACLLEGRQESPRLPAIRQGTTTTSACPLHGLLPASPQGPRERRHARRPHTAEEDKARPTRLLVVGSEHLAMTLALRKGRSAGTGAGSGEAAVPTARRACVVAGLGLAGVVGQEAHTREFEERLGIGAGPSRITPRIWSTDTGFHGNATRPQVAPAAA
jgi:hypothetical protein